ncbi:MAG: serine/threonine-protein phosphatase [Rhodanobacteraceae bacterium]|nr:MAG: serine/threonine-protein phosphatase [Rhodanobacteraceae bacterium]
MKLRSAGRTDVGKVRRRNEDAILNRPEAGLWVVADGLGGHAAGDYASRLIVERLAALPRAGSALDFVDSIEDVLDAVNGDLRRAARARNVDVIASTVVLLVRGENCLFCGWLGDSRAYCCEDGRLLQITRDHVYRDADAAGWLGDRVTPPAAGSAPLTRAVGVEQSLFVDWVLAGNRPGTCFVLCSDGLNKEMTDQEIGDVCCGSASAGEVLAALFATALSRAARDNISAVVVRLGGAVPALRSRAQAPPGATGTPASAPAGGLGEANRRLHGLNEDYRLGRISREEYRSRRRALAGTLQGVGTAAPVKPRWWSRLFGRA